MINEMIISEYLVRMQFDVDVFRLRDELYIPLEYVYPFTALYGSLLITSP